MYKRYFREARHRPPTFFCSRKFCSYVISRFHRVFLPAFSNFVFDILHSLAYSKSSVYIFSVCIHLHANRNTQCECHWPLMVAASRCRLVVLLYFVDIFCHRSQLPRGRFLYPLMAANFCVTVLVQHEL